MIPAIAQAIVWVDWATSCWTASKIAPAASYGEVTGVTQTVRNFGASLGLAVFGSVFISQNTDRVETTLTDRGVPASVADRIAHSLTTAGGGADAGGAPGQGGATASGERAEGGQRA